MTRQWMAHSITGANLFCGFLSILMTLNGMGGLAAWLIICAALLDAFDGKVARLMGSDGAFGLQFDSLADMVSFGIAPGVLVYWLAFQERGILGILISSIPPIFTAIRLAKFNVRAEKEAHEYVGLSSPLQGCLLASFIILNLSIWEDVHLEALLAVLIMLAALLMVSPLPLPSLPRLSLREPGYNLAKLLVLVGCVCLIALRPSRYAFPVLMSLVVVAFVVGALRAARSEDMEMDEDETESAESEIGVPRGRR